MEVRLTHACDLYSNKYGTFLIIVLMYVFSQGVRDRQKHCPKGTSLKRVKNHWPGAVAI